MLRLATLLSLTVSAGASFLPAPAHAPTSPLLAATAPAAPAGAAPAPEPTRRCAWVAGQVQRHNANRSRKLSCEAYHLQSTDANMFYRGVDYLFWSDFTEGGWGTVRLANYTKDGTSRTAAWTWITGDQHLSNFGAWMNRNNHVQFGANDFDEAVVADFHFDIHRVATSIYDHAITNGFKSDDADDAVKSFCKAYVEALQGYVGNEDELLFELTEDNAKGELKDFLEDVKDEDSKEEQLRKFTNVTKDGQRRFIMNNKTRLLPMAEDVRAQILATWTATGYGHTLEKVGWHAQEWDPAFFHIIDFAQRVGSGDGSYGVPRYYLLINGTDKYKNNSLNNVILDVKYEPPSAARATLNEEDGAWYDSLWENDGARVNQAQRRLTAYTDPWLGWIMLEDGVHLVKERSAWKDDIKVEKLDKFGDFEEYVEQVGLVIATAHARGSFADAPAQFKTVVTDVLDDKDTVKDWAGDIADIAAKYRDQVILDFECFKDWVDANYPLPCE